MTFSGAIFLAFKETRVPFRLETHSMSAAFHRCKSIQREESRPSSWEKTEGNGRARTHSICSFFHSHPKSLPRSWRERQDRHSRGGGKNKNRSARAPCPCRRVHVSDPESGPAQAPETLPLLCPVRPAPALPGASIAASTRRPSSRWSRAARASPGQTEVTVRTLADSACLKRRFRSCMWGDLGELLRFSGVLPGCCL